MRLTHCVQTNESESPGVDEVNRRIETIEFTSVEL